MTSPPVHDDTGARAGTVYLVGAGPGDPRLITERGAELLATADAVLHDDLVDPSLLARAKPGAEIVHVGKRGHRPELKQAKQSEIDASLVARARAGQSVVRLKGGDPFLFGRGSEEAEALEAAGIPFEVVPGVTSPIAVAAYAGVSLTHRELASSVTFVSATKRDGSLFDFAELRGLTGTVAVLMGVKKLPEIARAMIDRGGRAGTTPATVVERASTPRQRVVTGTLADIAERAAAEHIEAPATIVVGAVAGLRDRLSWFDAMPLFGKRVLVTRAEHQAGKASALLRARGAEPIEIATIAIGPAPDEALVARAIADLGKADVVAFTSENGVVAFFDALSRAGKDARSFGAARVASIGAATAEALARRGIVADIVPSNFRGEALAGAILADLAKGRGGARGARVVIPRALVAREALPDMLRAAGAEVDVVPVYETRPAGDAARDQLRARLVAGDIDVVLATSPSTIENLCELVGPDAPELLAKTLVASIGEVTADAVKRRGLVPGVVASRSTLGGLVDAIEALLERRRA